MKNALLSLYDKAGCEFFATELIALGFRIISSGGTAQYLRERGIDVTEVSELTGYPAVLGHRVVTLAPQIHGGLLATEAMLPELDRLEWPKIDLLYVTFYPLYQELNRKDATFESCIEKTDIGGPAMIRSANKGGTTIPIISREQEAPVLSHLKSSGSIPIDYMFRLRAEAEAAVSEYCELSARVYQTFAPQELADSWGDNG